MRGLLPFLLVAVYMNVLSQGFSQNSVLEPDPNKSAKDTISILLIPYNPLYYLSDSDRQIAEASNNSVVVIRNNFRKSLDESLKRQFAESKIIHSVLSDTTEQASIDLDRIYFEQILKYEESPSYKKTKKQVTRNKIGEERGMGKGVAKEEIDFLEDKYMNVTFSDPDLLPELAARYENDYFLFLTQFEIKIDFNDCLDIARKIYNRQLKVHYSVYDKDGNFISGDYAKVLFPSNTNNVNEIINRNFPQIARLVAESF